MMNEKVFWIAPIIVMAIGLLPMPYGYYTLSKLVVCGCSIYYAFHLYEKKDMTFVWVFGDFLRDLDFGSVVLTKPGFLSFPSTPLFLGLI